MKGRKRKHEEEELTKRRKLTEQKGRKEKNEIVGHGKVRDEGEEREGAV